LRGLTDEQFWERAEQRIYDAFEAYAQQAENGGGFQRRLFAEDAAQGFAFIDLCRKRYDVAVMNPPFGYPSDKSKAYVDVNYCRSKYDVLAAFVDRCLQVLRPFGKIGCITSRTVFFIEFFCSWRQSLLEEHNLCAFADLGSGVLEAMVETAACIIQPAPTSELSIFIRLLSSPMKSDSLATAMRAVGNGERDTNTFLINPAEFLSIQGCPLAYWVPSAFRSHFHRHGSVSDVFGDVRVGLQTGDDFRFIRCVWELPSEHVGEGQSWSFLAKGGEFRRFYDDIHLAVNWNRAGHEIIHLVDEKGKQRSRPQNIAYYYRPGITYPMRTRSSYSPRVLPQGCIFNVQGNTIFEKANDEERLLGALGVLSSAAFESFTRLKARIGDMTTAGGAGFAYTPGLIGSMPFPRSESKGFRAINSYVRQAIDCERAKDRFSEPSIGFVVPVLRGPQVGSLREAFFESVERYEELEIQAWNSAGAIEAIVQELYGFGPADKEEVESQFGAPVSALSNVMTRSLEAARKLYCETRRDEEHSESDLSQQRRMASDRYLRIDEICRALGVNPSTFVALRRQNGWERLPLLNDAIAALIQYLLGATFGRWDFRYAMGERPAPELPNPFAPLPVCPPGMLQGDDGLPISPEAGRRLRADGLYPLDVAWDGILVDDPEHPLDIERSVRAVLTALWGKRADALENEGCGLLGMQTLREWFRRPAGFFADHLKRYSRSRRQAPIYWSLSTKSGSYNLWIYYHRLTPDTLYKCLEQFVTPKLVDVEKELTHLRSDLAANAGGAKERNRLEELEELRRELNELRTELEIWAPKWKPNLNDGVTITAAPLWKLFRLPKWQKDLKACWQKLEKGEYDWSHLAFTLWPDRVREKCKTDRSLAIAHGLEDLCQVTAPLKKQKKKRGVPAESEMESSE